MTFDFLKRKPATRSRASLGACPTRASSPRSRRPQDYELKLTYRARSSKGVRFGPGEGSMAPLPRMLEEFNTSPIELVEPLEPQFADANPTVMRTIEASQWLNAHHHRSPSRATG